MKLIVHATNTSDATTVVTTLDFEKLSGSFLLSPDRVKLFSGMNPIGFLSDGEIEIADEVLNAIVLANPKIKHEVDEESISDERVFFWESVEDEEKDTPNMIEFCIGGVAIIVRVSGKAGDEITRVARFNGEDSAHEDEKMDPELISDWLDWEILGWALFQEIEITREVVEGPDPVYGERKIDAWDPTQPTTYPSGVTVSLEEEAP